MTSTPTGIIKKDSVRMAETPRNLDDVTPSASPSPSGPPGAAPSEPSVRIIEQDEAGALVEVTCGCGRRTYIQCDYAPAQGV